MKLKLFLWSPVLLLLFLIYLVLALIYLPGTASMALKLGQRFAPGELQFAQVTGSLAGPIQIHELSYRDQDFFLAVHRLSLNWQPSCLISAELCLHSLRLDDTQLRLPEPQAATEPSPEFSLADLQLPEIHLPLALNIREVALYNTRVEQGDAAYLLESLQLSLHTEGSEIQLNELRARHQDTFIALQGRLDPLENYAHALTLSWFLDPVDLLEVSGVSLEDSGINSIIQGQLELSGDKHNLESHLQLFLEHQETGPVQLNWQLQLEPVEERLTLKSLLLTLEETGTALQLQGQFESFAQGQLQLNWTPLNWPLRPEAGDPEFSLAPGQLLWEGRLEDYALKLRTSLQALDYPLLALELDAEGDLQQLSRLELRVQEPEGQATLSGRLGWHEQINWQLALSVENWGLQPWAGIEGLIQTLALESQGRLLAQGPEFNAELLHLNGQLLDEALSGQGRFQLRGETLAIEKLALNYGPARAEVHGQAGPEALGIEFDLSVPDLASAWPGAQGRVQLQGQAQGAFTELKLDAQVSAAQLALADIALQSLDGHIAVDLSGQQRSQIHLQAQGLALGTERITLLELEGSGTPEQHQLSAQLQGRDQSLALNLQGRWQSPRWQGQVQELSLFRQEIGAWQLSAPAQANFHGENQSFQLQDLCLQQQQGDAQLCVLANRSAQGRLEAELNLAQLSLRLLDPWLNGTELEANAELQARWLQPAQGLPSANLTLRTTPGQMRAPDGQIELALEPLSLDATLNNDQLITRLNLDWPELQGRIAAEVSVRQFSSQQLLQGEVDLYWNDLNLISLFAPQVQNLQGRVLGQLQLSGQVSSPRILGSLDWMGGSAELPALGITLAPIEISLLADGAQAEQMQLSGRIGSGPGQILLRGDLNLETQTGALRIRGEEFEAMNTEIALRISPDLQVDLGTEVLRLGGEVLIPYARIAPPKQQLQSVVRASDDVVLVQDLEQDLSDTGLRLITDIRLRLGDSVEVDAFGFKGRLLGSLRILDDGQSATRGSGSIQVESGQYRLYGQDLTISRGSLVFTGGPIDNPGLDLRVSRFVDDVEAGARVGGSLRLPELTLFSVPAMPDSSIMSYLVLGRGPGESSAAEQSMMMQAAMALTLQGGNQISGQIRDSLQLDELGFDSDDTGQSAFFIGKYLTPRLYVRYGISLLESVEVLTLSYRLSSMWRVETQSSSLGSGADFFYTRER
ncbi:translocation/assembly module TamB domain-containing protein [Nitrincola tapanii]|uniref:Translocation and assembly module TamB C-terminal domain-containing protein n=1 Tax=Nitrincola tapanii TaxID=1708751 RepID=A0A5A9W4J8_9GAMM|nr:translocation/assembly module TamB domain-containing protein [Nitrincola tapanii]KAA0875414.1 hypothetical protein E1H14_05350 [Nitrincola tapanii]